MSAVYHRASFSTGGTYGAFNLSISIPAANAHPYLLIAVYRGSGTAVAPSVEGETLTLLSTQTEFAVYGTAILPSAAGTYNAACQGYGAVAYVLQFCGGVEYAGAASAAAPTNSFYVPFTTPTPHVRASITASVNAGAANGSDLFVEFTRGYISSVVYDYLGNPMTTVSIATTVGNGQGEQAGAVLTISPYSNAPRLSGSCKAGTSSATMSRTGEAIAYQYAPSTEAGKPCKFPPEALRMVVFRAIPHYEPVRCQGYFIS